MIFDWHFKKSNRFFVLSFILSTFCENFVNAKTMSEIKQDKNCPDLSDKFSWDISQAQIYNRCYRWTAEHSNSKLKNWQYTPAKSDPSNPELTNSVHVTYHTNVAVPKFFRSYINNDNAWQIAVSKDIASENDRQMTEITQIDNLPMVGSMVLHSTYIARRNRVSAHLTYDLQIPWYLFPVQSLIENHVSHSITEYASIVLDSACSSNTEASYRKIVTS